MIPEWVSQLAGTISNCVVALSVAGVAVVGFAGLQQWQRELKGKSRFEIARRLGVLAFEFKDRFHVVMSLFTYGVESADRKRDEKESRAEADVLDEWYAKGKRMNSLPEAVKKLHEASWEGSILLGDGILRFTQPLEDRYHDLSVSFQTHFQMRLMAARRPSAVPPDGDWEEDHHAHIYGCPTMRSARRSTARSSHSWRS